MLQSPSANLGCWRPQVTKESPYQQDFSTLKYTQLPPTHKLSSRPTGAVGRLPRVSAMLHVPCSTLNKSPAPPAVPGHLCCWKHKMALPVSMCQARNIFWNSSRLSFQSMRQCLLNRQHQQPWAFCAALTTATDSSSLGELPCWLTLQEALQGAKKSHISSQENGKLWKTCITRLPA